MNKIIIVALACSLAFSTVVQAQQENHWKELTELEFPGGYPAAESSARLFDELDFLREGRVLGPSGSNSTDPKNERMS